MFHHASSLEHDTGAHPERAARIVAIERELALRDWHGFVPREGPEADRGALERVHPPEHVEAVRALCAAGGGSLDPDTVASAGSYAAALHATGGACAMVDALLSGGAPTAFCALRPPGHHAERARAMGFCLFNNVAVAARRALDTGAARRVLIVDWDVHHGNGTNDIFRDSGDVLFASIHQSPLYPGTGAAEDRGSGPGTGYTMNLPVPPGSGDATWLGLLAHVIAPAARAFEPELILVSAGYDAHADDPLADCRVTTGGFGAMAAGIRALGDELGAPVGATLEGGYDLGALAASVGATLDGLTAPAAFPEIEPDEVTAEARDYFLTRRA